MHFAIVCKTIGYCFIKPAFPIQYNDVIAKRIDLSVNTLLVEVGELLNLYRAYLNGEEEQWAHYNYEMVLSTNQKRAPIV